MLRVLRIEKVYVTNELKAELLRGLEVLKRHYPPSLVHLYAIPQLSAELINESGQENQYAYLDWLSPIMGQLAAYNALSQPEQARQWAEMRQKQASIQALQNELIKKGSTTDASHLQALLVEPRPEQLYVINNHLVITQWKKIPLTPSRAFTQPYAQIAHLVAPPEFTIILDTSYSMKLHVGVSQEDETWFFTIQQTEAELSARGKAIFKRPSRLSVAQEAIIKMLPLLHPQVLVRLVTFSSCEQVQDHGVFSATERPQLINVIKQLVPDGPTPLVNSLLYTASVIDGVNNDALILCFIDGADGCGNNIHEMADYLAQHKPKTRVNLVDLSGYGLSNVLAQKTGGRVYTSKKPKEISKMIMQSTNEIAAKPTKKNS